MTDHGAHISDIRQLVTNSTTIPSASVHGPSHWARVEANGVEIARAIGADRLVVVLFALFHDSMRLNDGHDPDHGPRAAEFVRSVRERLAFLTDDQVETLCHACEWHTHEVHNSDLTIGACYDGDRLDLWRVGIKPEPRFLNSPFARNMCVKRNEARGTRGGGRVRRRRRTRA